MMSIYRKLYIVEVDLAKASNTRIKKNRVPIELNLILLGRLRSKKPKVKFKLIRNPNIFLDLLIWDITASA